MNKTAIISAALAVSLFSSQIVFAQDATSGATVGRPNKPLPPPRMEKRLDNIQARMDDMREKMASREAAFKLKLDAFKDQRKAQIAQRVDTNLNQINANRTKEMLTNLGRMSQLLDKLETKSSSDSAKTAIADSRAKIASASTAATNQALNDYTITVTSESRIRIDAQTQRNKLYNDLKAVRSLVMEARGSVANALRLTLGIGKEATESGTQQ